MDYTAADPVITLRRNGVSVGVDDAITASANLGEKDKKSSQIMVRVMVKVEA